MQRHTTGADAWLQSLDKSIIGREVGSAIAYRERSLIFTIALFLSHSHFITGPPIYT